MKKALKNREIKELISRLNEEYGLDYSKKDRFEQEDSLILVNGSPDFFYVEDQIVPALKFLQRSNVLRCIVVDMGAVPFVVKGADIMRPGITDIDTEIAAGEYVAVVDVMHKKPLAVGKALFSGKDMADMKSGKVIKNIHYVGDAMWSYE